MTYAELDNTSSSVAQSLIAQGLRAMSFVPICFAKSLWAIVAMIAILKTGSAFVPIDPNWAPSYSKRLIKEVDAKIALVSDEYESQYSELIQAVFVLSRNTASSIPPAKASPSVFVGQNYPAYVMFTSGSSGKPKVVIIGHQQISTSSVEGGRAMGFGTHRRMLQFAAYTLDACIFETVVTLVFGGCVCIPSEFARLNELSRAVQELRANCALFTPSLLRTIPVGSMKSLQTVIVGGEAVPPNLIAAWSSQLELILAYGPTECTVACFALNTRLRIPQVGELGHAFAGRSWIVDMLNQNLLAPVGVAGELVMEGPILAQGYVSPDDQENGSFFEAGPWNLERDHGQKRRLYRTGDIMRYTEDGSIVFLGRNDKQVKINGKRLDLMQIEEHIRPLMKSDCDVAVDLMTGNTGQSLLVTFRSLAADAMHETVPAAITPRCSLLPSEIRHSLTQVLPNFMIPSFLVDLPFFH